ncbi:zinc ribbon domain-containing protein, partial [Streptomyces sp. NPDC055509]
MMSQMPQLSACPSCEEPLESGDRFCGACGYDLSAVPERPQDNPTITMNGSVPAQGAPAGEYPERPSAPPAGAPWPAPGSAQPQAPAAGAPMRPEAPPAAGVRFDRRPDGHAAPPETYQTRPEQTQHDQT